MYDHLTIKQELLARVMSDISERCYFAGWMKNLEYVLWHIMHTEEQCYGMDIVTQRDIDTLKLLSDESDSWIVYGDDGEIALPLIEWQLKFKKDTLDNPDLINY